MSENITQLNVGHTDYSMRSKATYLFLLLMIGAGTLLGQTIGVSWDLVGGQVYYVWAKENLSDSWQPISMTVMAGTNRLKFPYVYRSGTNVYTNTNTITFILADTSRPGYVRPETGNLMMEIARKPSGFFMVSTNQNGQGLVPIKVTRGI